MGKMPDGKVMYTLDGRPVTEEPEGSPEEKHYKRIINQVRGWGAGSGAARGCLQFAVLLVLRLWHHHGNFIDQRITRRPSPLPPCPQVSGYVREVCQQMTQTVPKAIVHCMVLQVRSGGLGELQLQPCPPPSAAVLAAGRSVVYLGRGPNLCSHPPTRCP